MSSYQLEQAKREIVLLKDLQKHVLDVSKRILIQQKINRLQIEVDVHKKNTRREGRVLRLRSRLRCLVALILPQTDVREKGVYHDPSQ